jgi:hypothetical protein
MPAINHDGNGHFHKAVVTAVQDAPLTFAQPRGNEGIALATPGRRDLMHPVKPLTGVLPAPCGQDGRIRPIRNGGGDARRFVKGHDCKPEILDGPHHLDELVDTDGFLDVAIGMKVVTLEDVLFGIGNGNHGDGNAFQERIALDVLQDLPAVLLGQVEIQEDYIRPGGLGARAWTP